VDLRKITFVTHPTNRGWTRDTGPIFVKRSPKSKVQSPKSERKCKASIEESSQFASALLLSSKIGGWEIEVVGENADESPYVAMTSKLLEAFPKNGGTFQIEPDASSGSYFWAVDLISPEEPLPDEPISFGPLAGVIAKTARVSNITVCDWPISGWQIDEFFMRLSMVSEVISRSGDLGDSIMTTVVLAPFAGRKILFTDLGRLRLQECERVVALRTELTKCGAKVIEEGDTLTVYPSKLEELHGAEIETYNDHRMAMCFAILGLKVPGIKIKNPACVKKTFPNFFQKLAAQPPHGLGAEIWEIKNGQRTRKLSGEDLFAD
jgi:3-phosphoshikimate 1-carboxyvinyltransferase